jgi:hypothetical protein
VQASMASALTSAATSAATPAAAIAEPASVSDLRPKGVAPYCLGQKVYRLVISDSLYGLHGALEI